MNPHRRIDIHFANFLARISDYYLLHFFFEKNSVMTKELISYDATEMMHNIEIKLVLYI